MQPMDNEARLSFEGLCAGYDGEEKLHGVTSALRQGELTALIGPNGCGKSTLIKCLAGQLKPTAGVIQLMGRTVSTLRPNERARLISYMPQSRLVPEIPVRQLVTHGRYPHLKWGQRPGPADRQIVTAAIDRVGIATLAHKPVCQLSGGERQRAYMAMMLAQQARVMLLDEPTTYLDPSGQFELMALLCGLRDEGLCIGVVLHDLNLAMTCADRMIVMAGGRIAAEGTPREIHAAGILEAVFNVRVREVEGQYLFMPMKANL